MIGDGWRWLLGATIITFDLQLGQCFFNVEIVPEYNRSKTHKTFKKKLPNKKMNERRPTLSQLLTQIHNYKYIYINIYTWCMKGNNAYEYKEINIYINMQILYDLQLFLTFQVNVGAKNSWFYINKNHATCSYNYNDRTQ